MKIDIPLNVQVTQFIQSKYGTDPIRYNHKDPHILLLFHLLKCKSKNDPVIPSGRNPTKLILPPSLIQQKRTYISTDAIKQYNESMISFLRSEIRAYVRFNVSNRNIKITEAILEARTKFGLTEDILPYETIKKDIYRHRKLSENYDYRSS